MRSLGAEYDVERQGCPRENHHNKNHSRWGNLFNNLKKKKAELFFEWNNDMFLFWVHNTYCVMFAASFLSAHLIPIFPLTLFFDPLLIPHPFRLAFEGQEASPYYQNPRDVSSTHSSPYKTVPRPPRDQRSMPPTPVMTRNAYSSSQLRCDLCSPALKPQIFFLLNNNFNQIPFSLQHPNLKPNP